ncbi:MAG: hypothetical protein JWR49_7 [Tardiphaga sp.]|nr:hypothetical protein [Tardiphaga sp.]
MANIPNPNDPYRPFPADEDVRAPLRLDNELQPDPELAEGRAGNGRIAMLALGIAVLLGVVFFGLNNGTMNPADATKTATQTAPVTQGTAQKAPAPTNNIADSDSSRPAVPPGVRDVTPYNNSNNQPGTTTGAAPARPQQPQAAPTGTEADRSKNGSAK